MFGEMLKRLRVDKMNLSLRKAAKLIPSSGRKGHLSHTYLFHLETNDKPLSLENLVRICNAYGYRVEISAIRLIPGSSEEVVSWIV